MAVFENNLKEESLLISHHGETRNGRNQKKCRGSLHGCLFFIYLSLKGFFFRIATVLTSTNREYWVLLFPSYLLKSLAVQRGWVESWQHPQWYLSHRDIAQRGELWQTNGNETLIFLLLSHSQPHLLFFSIGFKVQWMEFSFSSGYLDRIQPPRRLCKSVDLHFKAPRTYKLSSPFPACRVSYRHSEYVSRPRPDVASTTILQLIPCAVDSQDRSHLLWSHREQQRLIAPRSL